MLRWLDSNANRKAKPNENYARELMELFTMGVGNYTETDVREAARAFTGWFLDRTFRFAFNPRQHDTGLKTFLGQQGRWDGDDIIDVIVQQPVTAEYMARKLFAFFVHDHPPQPVIEQLAGVFRDGYRVRDLVRAILLHPEFTSPDAYHAVVKSPAEFLVGTMKLLGIQEFLPGAPGALNRMGMALFNPPSVAGWDWGTSWIGTNTLLERWNVANALTTQRGQNAHRGMNLAALAENLPVRAPQELVDGLLDLLVDGDVEPAVRQGLLDYARHGYGPADRQWVDRTLRGVAHLIASTPVYQMA